MNIRRSHEVMRYSALTGCGSCALLRRKSILSLTREIFPQRFDYLLYHMAMTHPDRAIYGPRKLVQNVNLLKVARVASDPASLKMAVESIVKDFHPSILAELDRSDLRPGEPPSISDLNFRLTAELIPRNIQMRAQQLGVDESLIEHIDHDALRSFAKFRSSYYVEPRVDNPQARERCDILVVANVYADTLIAQISPRIACT